MYTKVLVSDDLGSITHGVIAVLNNLGIKEVQEVLYCDDAYLKIKRAWLDNAPYNLLITDLSFKPDHREQTYPSGESLIIALKQEYPELKIIVYSVEDRLQKVRFLMQKHQTNGFVCKGRKGLVELEKAIHSVYNNNIYLSPQISQALRAKIDLEIEEYDIELMNLLSKGFSQEDISIHLKNKNISPSSLSSVEKRLNKLRIQFEANNAIHLVATVKDLGLI